MDSRNLPFRSDILTNKQVLLNGQPLTTALFQTFPMNLFYSSKKQTINGHLLSHNTLSTIFLLLFFFYLEQSITTEVSSECFALKGKTMEWTLLQVPLESWNTSPDSFVNLPHKPKFLNTLLFYSLSYRSCQHRDGPNPTKWGPTASSSSNHCLSSRYYSSESHILKRQY